MHPASCLSRQVIEVANIFSALRAHQARKSHLILLGFSRQMFPPQVGREHRLFRFWPTDRSHLKKTSDRKLLMSCAGTHREPPMRGRVQLVVVSGNKTRCRQRITLRLGLKRSRRVKRSASMFAAIGQSDSGRNSQTRRCGCACVDFNERIPFRGAPFRI
jgi:hypothetical protein